MASDSIDICLVVPASRSIHRTDNDTASMTAHGLWHGRYSLNTPRYLHSRRRFAIDRIATRCQCISTNKGVIIHMQVKQLKHVFCSRTFAISENCLRSTVYDTFVLVFDEQVDRMSNRIQTCCCLTYWNHALIRKSQFFFGRWGQKFPHRRTHISIWTVSSLYSESRHKADTSHKLPKYCNSGTCSTSFTTEHSPGLPANSFILPNLSPRTQDLPV